jgi:pilus assembly protein FimV
MKSLRQQEDKQVEQQIGQPGSTEPEDRETNDEISLFDESPKVDGAAEKTEVVEEDDLDNLGFLSDDEIEIESVDGVEEVNIMSNDDEAATKLELAYAYQKMGDAYGAREILQEVIAEGNEAQAEEARGLLVGLDDAD